MQFAKPLLIVSTQDTVIDVLVNDRAGHAESPLWSPGEGALYWVDTRAARVYRYIVGSGKRDSWTVPTRFGAVGLRRGGLIAAIKTGIGFLDTATGAFEHLVDPEADRADTRINDAKTDRAGRFWFGSTHDDATEPIGKLYRFDADRSVTVADTGYTIPNGFAWSPDNRHMYVSDSPRLRINAYDFDLATGSAGNRRTFAQIPENHGTPDGSTIDSQGYVWNAQFGGGVVTRYAPDGTVDRVIDLPTQRPTNVMLGGDDLRTLYVTTATGGLTPEQLEAQPLAGAVLAIRVDVPGIPEPLFAG